MINILGAPERSTRHATCVRKVYRYLKQKYGEANYEQKTVADRITDALGYSQKSKTWYLCEIKVNWSDLQKSPYQIHDTAFRFQKSHKGDTVVPVIAFPARLQKELVNYDNWDSLRDTCRRLGIAIWVVEQSGVREEITSPKAKVVKTKSARTSTSNTKTSGVKKVKAKPRAIKSDKINPTKAETKKKTASKAPATKRKTSKERVTKARVAIRK